MNLPKGPSLPELTLTEFRALQSAEAWLELGLPEEASLELARLDPSSRARAEVLAIQWKISHRQGRWAESRTIAASLVELEPSSVDYWLWFARSTRRTEGLQSAYQLLFEVHDNFKEPMIPFNLACYQAQLGNLALSRRWLAVAVRWAKSVGPDALKKLDSLAQEDSDLQPLRDKQVLQLAEYAS